MRNWKCSTSKKGYGRLADNWSPSMTISSQRRCHVKQVMCLCSTELHRKKMSRSTLQRSHNDSKEDSDRTMTSGLYGEKWAASIRKETAPSTAPEASTSCCDTIQKPLDWNNLVESNDYNEPSSCFPDYSNHTPEMLDSWLLGSNDERHIITKPKIERRRVTTKIKKNTNHMESISVLFGLFWFFFSLFLSLHWFEN